MRKYYRNSKASVLKYLRQGITPQKLAFTLVLGLSVGLIPVIGVSTIICVFLAFLFRLNHIILQVVQFSLFPFQLLLLVPYYNLGNHLLSKEEAFFSRDYMHNIFLTPFIEVSEKFFINTCFALIAWITSVIIPGIILYVIFLFVFKKINLRVNRF